jgi:MarR family transcriptional regulator, transcriptional regulator for hemolysin
MSDISVGTLLGEVSKLLRRRFEQLAREHELTLPQWRILGELHRRDGISQKALADAMDADAMTVSGILDRLEKRGLLVRTVDPADSRAKLAKLTAEGAALIAETRKLGGQLMEQVLEGLAEDERQVLANCLNHIRTRLCASLNDLNKDA